MNNDRDTLRRIAALQEPRHLFILPAWAKPEALDHLIQDGYVTFSHLQRTKGVTSLVTDLQLTAKGRRKMETLLDWPQLALKGALAGASFTVMSVVLLYLG
jgi:hypothetical protein